MLEGLFEILKTDSADGRITAEVALNASHGVFEGHFPQRAVMPGVCQMYAVRAVMSHVCGRTMVWESVRDVKFLSPILPDNDIRLMISIVAHPTQDGKMKIEAVIATETEKKTKIRAIFV